MDTNNGLNQNRYGSLPAFMSAFIYTDRTELDRNEPHGNGDRAENCRLELELVIFPGPVEFFSTLRTYSCLGHSRFEDVPMYAGVYLFINVSRKYFITYLMWLRHFLKTLHLVRN